MLRNTILLTALLMIAPFSYATVTGGKSMTSSDFGEIYNYKETRIPEITCEEFIESLSSESGGDDNSILDQEEQYPAFFVTAYVSGLVTVMGIRLGFPIQIELPKSFLIQTLSKLELHCSSKANATEKWISVYLKALKETEFLGGDLNGTTLSTLNCTDFLRQSATVMGLLINNDPNNTNQVGTKEQLFKALTTVYTLEGFSAGMPYGLSLSEVSMNLTRVCLSNRNKKIIDVLRNMM